MNWMEKTIKMYFSKKRQAAGVVRKPERIEKMMRDNGVTLENGILKLYAFTPSGQFSSDTVARTHDDLDLARRSELSIRKSVANEKDFYEKLKSNANEFKAMVGVSKSLKRACKKLLSGFIRARARVEDKKIININIDDVTKIVEGGQLTKSDIKNLNSSCDKIIKSCEALIARFVTQTESSIGRTQLFDALSNLERNHPDILHTLSGVIGQVKRPVRPEPEVVKLRKGKIGDLVKQIQTAIKDKAKIEFIYVKETGPEKKEVSPKKLVKYKGGMLLIGVDVKKRAVRKYYLKKVR